MRLTGAVILGAGLLLGGASPALASEQETGPNSEACQPARDDAAAYDQEATAQEQRAVDADAEATAREEQAAEQDQFASEQDRAASDYDAEAEAQQQRADDADAEAQRQQDIADEADTEGDTATRDAARQAAADARAERDEARAAAEQARQDRDDAREHAEGARKARDDARAFAEAARIERDEARAAAAEARENRDAAREEAEKVCAEPTLPPKDDEQPGGETPEDEPEFIDKDCADLTHDEAQALLEQDSSGPHRLDADDDGIACEAGGGQEDTESCDQAGVVHDSGDWVWNCERWIPISEDEGPAPKGGVETGEGGLAYTGVSNALGWLAGGLGLVGAGALTMAAGPRLLRRS